MYWWNHADLFEWCLYILYCEGCGVLQTSWVFLSAALFFFFRLLRGVELLLALLIWHRDDFFTRWRLTPGLSSNLWPTKNEPQPKGHHGRFIGIMQTIKIFKLTTIYYENLDSSPDSVKRSQTREDRFHIGGWEFKYRARIKCLNGTDESQSHFQFSVSQ